MTKRRKPTYHRLSANMLRNWFEARPTEEELFLANIKWKTERLRLVLDKGTRVAKWRRKWLCRMVAPRRPIDETWERLDWPRWRWARRNRWYAFALGPIAAALGWRRKD